MNKIFESGNPLKASELNGIVDAVNGMHVQNKIDAYGESTFNVTSTPKQYKHIDIKLKANTIYHVEVSSIYEGNAPIYIRFVDNEGNMKNGHTISSTDVQKSSFYSDTEVLIDVYSSAASTVTITIRRSVADNTLIKKLPTTLIDNKYVAYKTGVLTTSTAMQCHKVDEVSSLKLIHFNTMYKDNVSAAIAFYDENENYIKDESIQGVAHNGKTFWYCAKVPLSASYAIISSAKADYTPIVGTIDNGVKEPLEMRLDKFNVVHSRVVFNETTNQSKEISIKDVSNDSQLCFRVKSLQGGELTLTMVCNNNSAQQAYTISNIGEYYITKLPSIETIRVYKTHQDNVNILDMDVVVYELPRIYRRQENSYIKRAGDVKLGALFHGYYNNADYRTIYKDNTWASYPWVYTNGHRITIDCDYTTYYVNFKYIPLSDNDGKWTVAEKNITNNSEIDLSYVLAWTIQIRRIDRTQLVLVDVENAINCTVIGDVWQRPAPVESVEPIINAGVENFSSLINSRNSLTYPSIPLNIYGHLFVEDIYLSSKPVIPNQSIHDVAVTAMLGFKMMEANVNLTSDGVAVTGHGAGNGKLETLEDLSGNAVSIDTKTITYEALRTNYRYKSKYAQYRTPITSLEEFLRACVRYNLTPFVQCVNKDIIGLIESIVGKNYVCYDGNRSWTDVCLYKYISGTTTSLLNSISTNKPPYLLGVHQGTLDAFSDEEIIDLLNKTHKLGAKLCWAGNYHSSVNNLRYKNIGLDISSSGYEVPDFDYGNEKNVVCNSLKGFSEISDKTATDGVLILQDSDTCIVSAEQKSIIAKASLHIHYKGSLKIQLGYISDTFTSDGLKEIALTSVIKDKAPVLTLISEATTEIYSVSWRVSSVV